MKNLFIIFMLVFIGVAVNTQAQEWQNTGNIVNYDSYYNYSDGWNSYRTANISDNGNTLITGNGTAKKVYVYENNNYGNWEQKGSTIEGTTKYFGYRADVCEDGNTIIISAPCYYNNYHYNIPGKVIVYSYISGDWQLKGNPIEELKPGFGSAIALSADGNTIALTTSDNGNSTTKVYEYVSDDWQQNGNDITNIYASSLNLSSDGSIISISSSNETKVYEYISNDWQQKGQTLNGNNNALNNDGSIITVIDSEVKLYSYNTGTWQQLGANIDPYQYSYISRVDINGDGNIVILSYPDLGSYVYEYISSDWVQKGNVISSGIYSGNSYNLSMSYDGNTFINEYTYYLNAMVYQYCDTTFTVNVNGIQNADCGQHNGSAVANAINGYSPYIYYWPNHDTLSSTDSLKVGNNYVIATDYKGCKARTDFTIDATNTPSISLNNITNVSCFGGNNGAINTTIDGNVASILWSNGNTTSNITNLMAGIYSVTITSNDECTIVEEYTVTEPQEITVDLTINNSTCGNTDGSATINSVKGGTAPYTFTWSAGTNTNLSAGIYYLTITDDNACSKIESFVINDIGAPTINIDSVYSADCEGTGGVYVSISGASGSQTYDWNNDGTGDNDDAEDLTSVVAGIYTLTVTDGACQSSIIAEIEINKPNTQQICVATVDTLVNHNLIVWEKEITTTIHHYNIYRENASSGVYENIANVLYDDMSEYEDMVANPSISASRYKISAVNNCDVESELSLAHRTIHQTMSSGNFGSYNLDWNNYEGMYYQYILVQRYLNSTGWLVIDTLNPTTTTYSNTPPNTDGLKYLISIDGIYCVPTSNAKTTGGPYTEALSNLEEDDYATNYITIIKKIETDNNTVKIYPNPTTKFVNIESNKVDLSKIYIINIAGEIVKQITIYGVEDLINIEDLTKGIYILKIETEKSVTTHKLIKN